ncbi:hypothetical protein [Komagataeibacter europaeus]|uniref:hypothetical protein n=1 Tax=Komagataeibacter europaeus TaxID=33995 RepID=UPI000B3EDAF4|nr:hypothetical protein [Komagataeibacter europaeus]ARW16407.1 hypothetical protein S101446_01276 [Komagataeibacter europaeus]
MSDEPTSAAAPADAPAGGSATDTILGGGAESTTTEAQPPAGAAATEGAAPNSEGAPESGEQEKPPEKHAVPEKYEFTPPEGFSVDEKAMGDYEAAAREAGLTQEQFSAITQHGLQFVQQQLEQAGQAQHEQAMKWRQEVLSDRTLSDGTGLNPEAKAAADRVIQSYGGKDLVQALAETGAGNNPTVIRAFVQIGKAMGLAEPPDKGKPAPEKRSGSSFDDIAQRLYGQSAKAGA